MSNRYKVCSFDSKSGQAHSRLSWFYSVRDTKPHYDKDNNLVVDICLSPTYERAKFICDILNKKEEQ